MSKQRFTLHVDLHLLLLSNDKVLLLRRYQTGFADGYYSLVAGHLDEHETASQGIAREANEEAGLVINPRDLDLVHTMHHLSNGSERIALFFTVRNWIGEPKNTEPEKCDDMNWFSIQDMPDNTVPYVKTAIDNYLQGNIYCEFGWNG